MVWLSDGLIELRVDKVHGHDVQCEVVNGGLLGEHKGINLPGTVVTVPSLTEKDEKDLEFGIKHGVDIIAVSFIRTADDVRYVKRRVTDLNSEAWVIAKLEKPQAIEHLEDILEVSDGVMVARGDLGVETSVELVPVYQKRIIEKAVGTIRARHSCLWPGARESTPRRSCRQRTGFPGALSTEVSGF